MFVFRCFGSVFTVKDFFSGSGDFRVELINFAELISPARIKSVLFEDSGGAVVSEGVRSDLLGEFFVDFIRSRDVLELICKRVGGLIDVVEVFFGGVVVSTGVHWK